MHVVDHVKGQPTPEQRNVLVESARIARGNIKDLATLDVKGLDALIIPGRIVWALPVHGLDIPQVWNDMGVVGWRGTGWSRAWKESQFEFFY